jgi:hypothetical protein
VGALLAWVALAFGAQAVLSRARRAGVPGEELSARRRLQPALVAEHAALGLLILSGFALLRHHGWGLGHARWLALKMGLVAFLVVPLETIHAVVCHRWMARGLRQTQAPPFSKDLERAIGMDDMVRVLAVPLLGLGLPLILWLSMFRPF